MPPQPPRRSRAPLFAGLLFLVALAAAGGAFVLIAKPFGPAATPAATEVAVKPTAKPTARPTAKPTARTTAAPTEAASSEPTPPPSEEPTVEPTDLPTEEPTAQPSATADIPTTTCRNDDAGITVTYRSDWFASTEAATQCLRIDREPVETAEQARTAAIVILPVSLSYADLVALYRDTAKYEVIDEFTTLTVDGLEATALLVRNTGNGSDFSNGVEELVVLVNRIGADSLIIGTAGVVEGEFDANQETLAAVVRTMKIDQ